MFKYLQFIILVIIFQRPVAAEVADAFIVRIYDKSIKVLSPVNKKKKVSVIIDNRTLNKLYGRIQSDVYLIKNLSVESGKKENIQFEWGSEELIYFNSMAPSFQRAPLVFGKKSYEIPKTN